MRCLLSVDDTDSQFGRCTTHLAFRMVTALMESGCSFSSYPRLVRLNPNVPFKTRGNAAVCLAFECQDEDEVFETARSLLLEEADAGNGANSGLVCVREGFNSSYFRNLYLRALRGMVSYTGVLAELERGSVRHFTIGNGMGVVGASASLGFSTLDDHTYELIAYRRSEMCGTIRRADAKSVVKMESETHPHTFNNYDHGARRVLLFPHGPDPVLLGIRADSPEAALRAFNMVGCSEEPCGYMIYVTNQCTDAHLAEPLRLPLKAYASGWIEGKIETVESGRGGHLYLELDAGKEKVRAGIYEPAGDLRRIAGRLAVGDSLRIFGGVRRPTARHSAIVNVEKIEVKSSDGGRGLINPTCSRCGHRMKSEGREKGFQCRACGARSHARRTVCLRGRLMRGVYIPSPGAQRHLTKQLIRYGAELTGTTQALIADWISAPGLKAQRERKSLCNPALS